MNTITSTDHSITPEVLPHSDSVPDSVRKRYLALLKNEAVVRAVNRVVGARQELLEIAGFNSEMGRTVLAIMNGGEDDTTAALKVLRERELAFQSLCAEALAAKGAWKSMINARRDELQPLLARVTRELLDSGVRREHIEQLIKGFERARLACHERLKTAGLSDEEISRIGLKPTLDDRAGWVSESAQLKERGDQITAFLASAPLFDVSLLGTDASA